MELSISMPAEDVAFLDTYAHGVGGRSRSAVIRLAVRALRQAELGPACAQAWAEWASSAEPGIWDSALTDGLGPDQSKGRPRCCGGL